MAKTPSCPKCGSTMVLRTARKGRFIGKKFYGCSKYPYCKSIVDISEVQKEKRESPKRNQRRFFRKSIRSKTLSPDTPYNRSYQFIKDEFFKFDKNRFNSFLTFYGLKYGQGAKRYLINTFEKWKNGFVRISKQTENRILECVPKFIDVDKQFKILSFYLPHMLEHHVTNIRKSTIDESELNEFYYQLTKNTAEKTYHLDWFVKHVFSEEEIKTFVDVVKYTTLEKLGQSYEFSKDDLVNFKQILSQIDYSIDFEYKISLINVSIRLNNVTNVEEEKKLIQILPPEIITRYNKWYKDILLNHSLEAISSTKISHQNQIFALNDIEMILSYLNQRKSTEEYETSAEVKGKGGTAYLRIIKRNLAMMKLKLFRLGVKCLIINSILIIIIILLLKSDLAIVIFWGLILGGWILFYSPIKEVVDHYKEIKEYERKRKRFAEI